MGNMEESDLHQKAVYWAANGLDNYGEPKLDAGVEINVRWEYKKRELLDAKGNTVAIDAVAVVDREVTPGSTFWLGTQKAYNALSTDPVRYYAYSYKAIPDVKNRATRKTVMLMKLGTELPTSA